MPEAVVDVPVVAEDVIFTTIPEMNFETMTDGGVEFVLCASALTAQM